MRKNSIEIAVIAIFIIAALIAVILYFGRAIGNGSTSVTGTVSGVLRSGSSQENRRYYEATALQSDAGSFSNKGRESEHKGRESEHAPKRFIRVEGAVTEDDIPVPPDGGDLPPD